MKKLSFLIAAHNEEKIIARTLDSLSKLPYEDYEVIIGLDGCTDSTEDIVEGFCRKSKKFRHYNLDLRQGKAAVINKIIRKAKGEIIIINDADWIFRAKDGRAMQKWAGVFDDPSIGGIAESFPVEWDRGKMNSGDWGYKMVAYSSYFWINSQKRRFTYEKGGLLHIKSPEMFLTNIFRKKLYKPNVSLGDDFERTKEIINSGYDVVLLKNPGYPRMIASYNRIGIADIFKQKIRTAMARRQLEKCDKMSLQRGYYLDTILYMLKESWKAGVEEWLLTTLWIMVTSIATLSAQFKRADTKEGWRLRAQRRSSLIKPYRL